MVKCGGSGVRGEVVLRAANQNRSLAGGKRSIFSAICSECLAPDDFFGYFLVRTQESNIYCQLGKLKFDFYFNSPVKLQVVEPVMVRF